jgi:hypothetical protein
MVGDSSGSCHSHSYRSSQVPVSDNLKPDPGPFSGRRTGVIARETLWKHPDMVHMGAEGLYGVEAPNVWLLVKGGRVGHCTF